MTYVDILAEETVDEKIVKSLRKKINIASKVMGEELKRLDIMELLNLKDIRAIAHDKNVLSHLIKKELNTVKKTKYKKSEHDALYMSSGGSIFENKTHALLNKFRLQA